MARFAQNSPGGLAESFQQVQGSGMEVEVGTDKPYGRRLNEGFDGADSLGRIYHNQPTWFFSDAVTEVATRDRKSTRLNSSHQIISYAVFCLKKKKKK